MWSVGIADGEPVAPEALGCWTDKRATPRGKYNQVSRCFLPGQQMRGWYFEGDEGLGGDIEGTWQRELDHAEAIAIDDEWCTVEIVDLGNIIRVLNCSYAGVWFRDRDAERRLQTEDLRPSLPRSN
jgi:hypothetical protein